jgi:hypothetical protein
MSVVKLNNNVVYQGEAASVRFVSDWNNSMAEYYSHIEITILDENLTPRYEKAGYGNMSHYEAKIDVNYTEPEQLARQLLLEKKRKLQRELDEIKSRNETLKVGDTILIHKGRKYQSGTVGIVFWVGMTQYGASIGFTVDNKKLFVSPNNCFILRGEDKFKIVSFEDKFGKFCRV